MSRKIHPDERPSKFMDRVTIAMLTIMLAGWLILGMVIYKGILS